MMAPEMKKSSALYDQKNSVADQPPLKHAISMMKSKAPKKSYRTVPPKKNEVKLRSNSEIENIHMITSKKELILIFLKDLSSNIIASKENTSYRDFTDSGGTDLSYDDLFSIHVQEEMEGESKKSFLSSVKSSGFSMISDRMLEKFTSRKFMIFFY